MVDSSGFAPLLPHRRRRAGRSRPTILLTEADPYLAFLIRLGLPQAEVVEADAGPLTGQAEAADLVISDLTDPRVRDLLSNPSIKVVGIADRSVVSKTSPSAEPDDVLVRPFLPAELYRTVRRALGLPSEDTTPETGRLERIRSWFGPARVTAVAAAAVLELAEPDVPHLGAVLLASAFLYVAIRLVVDDRGARWAWADAVAAAALLAATGGFASSYLLFGLVVSAEVGLMAGARSGAVAGLMMSAAAAPSAVGLLRSEAIDQFQFVLWTIGFPVAAAAGALTGHIWRRDRVEGVQVLAEANQVLSTLYRIARSVPGSLELGSVAQAATDEVRETLGAPAGALLVGDAGMFVVTGSFGLSHEGSIAISRDDPSMAAALAGGVRILDREELPQSLGLGSHECWLAAPLERDGIMVGALLAACNDHERHDANRVFLQHLTQETAVAVENARLYARVGELSAHEERRRLARELHDGVAQGLTHVRFELGLLSRTDWDSEPAVRGEVARLERVVGRALDEVRSTVAGLRASANDAGLGEVLHGYLRDLRGLGGPEIDLKVHGTVRLAPPVQEEVFRIVQEAVSNALRHAHADHVTVTLGGSDELVWLTVEDDGIGIPPSSRRGSGLGLVAMQERAERVGGRLEVSARSPHGTVVRLTAAATAQVLARKEGIA